MKKSVLKLLSLLFVASFYAPISSLKLSDIVSLRKKLNEKLPEKERILTESSVELNKVILGTEITKENENDQSQNHHRKAKLSKPFGENKDKTTEINSRSKSRFLEQNTNSKEKTNNNGQGINKKKAQRALKTKAKASKKANTKSKKKGKLAKSKGVVQKILKGKNRGLVKEKMDKVKNEKSNGAQIKKKMIKS